MDNSVLLLYCTKKVKRVTYLGTRWSSRSLISWDTLQIHKANG